MCGDNARFILNRLVKLARMTPIILFDAYGTLVELDDFYHRLQRGFRQHGYDLPLEIVTRAAHREMKHYIGNSLRAHQNDEWHKLRSECASILAASIREQGRALDLDDETVLRILGDAIVFRAFPETRAVLESLRARGYSMGIMSNWDYQLSDVLRSLDLDGFFNFILSSAQVGHEKPAPQFFERALQEARRMSTHVAPHQVFYIGDHYEKDVAPSRRAGMTPLWLVRDKRDLVSGEICEAQNMPTIATLNEVEAAIDELTIRPRGCPE